MYGEDAISLKKKSFISVQAGLHILFHTCYMRCILWCKCLVYHTLHGNPRPARHQAAKCSTYIWPTFAVNLKLYGSENINCSGANGMSTENPHRASINVKFINDLIVRYSQRRTHKEYRCLWWVEISLCWTNMTGALVMKAAESWKQWNFEHTIYSSLKIWTVVWQLTQWAQNCNHYEE